MIFGAGGKGKSKKRAEKTREYFISKNKRLILNRGKSERGGDQTKKKVWKAKKKKNRITCLSAMWLQLVDEKLLGQEGEKTGLERRQPTERWTAKKPRYG